MIEIRETGVYHEWFETLRGRMAKARIDVHIRCIFLGNFRDVKPVGKGVLEPWIDYGTDYRVYFSRHGNTLVI